MKKQITKQPKEEVNIKELEEMSGEKDVMQAPKYTLPSLKLNGKTGSFFRTVIEGGELKIGDDGKTILEDLGDSISGTILKVRKTYFADAADNQIYTNEVSNSKSAQVSVFCKTENIKGGFNTTFVFKGTADEVKKRYPEISMIQIVYFLLEETGEIVRLKVKGMSLGQLFNYWKEFESGDHIFEFITELGVKPDKNKYGKFFVNTFKKGKRVANLGAVQTAMKEVCDNLSKIEEFYADRVQEIPVETTDDIPVIKEKGEEEIIDSPEKAARVRETLKEPDDIDVSKIPL